MPTLTTDTADTGDTADLRGRTPFRFVLLCHQRSGSNALGAILNDDPDIWIYGQLFNHFAGYRRRNRRRGFPAYKPHPRALHHFGQNPPLRPRLERAALSLLPRTSSLDHMMETFWTRYRPGSGVLAKGFKLHDFQIGDRELQALATRHVDGVVMLSRTNLLKAAVSWGYAIQTDIWSRRDAARKSQPVLSLDPAEIGWFIEKTGAEVARWRSLLTEADANWIELNYERDIETRELEGLYRFLGVPYRGRPDFKTKRLSAPGYTHIANAEELDRMFGCDETGRLFG